jgi:hypothetical protein
VDCNQIRGVARRLQGWPLSLIWGTFSGEVHGYIEAASDRQNLPAKVYVRFVPPLNWGSDRSGKPTGAGHPQRAQRPHLTEPTSHDRSSG